MSDSTRRALRTAYQVLLVALTLALALVAFVEPIRALWPQAAGWVLGLAAFAGAATKILAGFESQFPAAAIWLRAPDTYKLPDSTRRALRTALTTLVGGLGFLAGLAAFVPQLSTLFPDKAGIIAAVVTGAALLSKIVNSLEDAGHKVPILTGPAKTPTAEPVGQHEVGAPLEPND